MFYLRKSLVINAANVQECSCWCLELMINAEVLGARENQVQLFHAVPQRAVHHLERGPQILELASPERNKVVLYRNYPLCFFFTNRHKIVQICGEPKKTRQQDKAMPA